MNNRQLIAVLVTLGLVAVGVVFKYKANNATGGNTDVDKMSSVLPGFALNDVVGITLKSKKDEVNLARTGDTWGVKERDGYPANYNFVRDLVTKVWELKVVEATEIGKSQLGRLHLIDPTSKEAETAKDEEIGTLVIFKKEGDQEIGRLLLGKTIDSAENSDNPFFNMGGSAGRFVQSAAKTDKAFKVKESFSSLNVEPTAWLDKTSFISGSGTLKSMEVKVSDPADQSWKIDREKETAELVLSDKKEGENVDADKVKGATPLSSATFTDVATAAEKEKTGLDNPKRTATVSYFDGFSYTVKLGNKVKPDDEASDYYMAINVAYTPTPEPTAPTDAAPTEPTPTPAAAGETEEQKKEREKKDADARSAYEEAKKRVDDAKRKYDEDKKKWEDDKKAREERFAKEKGFEDRVFKVSKFTADWFLKDRKYFLKEAPAAPAADAAPGTAPTPVPAPGTSVTTPPIAVPPMEAPKPKRIEAVTPPVSIEIPPKSADDKKGEPLVKPAPEAPKPEAPATDAPKPADPAPAPAPTAPPAGN